MAEEEIKPQYFSAKDAELAQMPVNEVDEHGNVTMHESMEAARKASQEDAE
jgi:hypothetical protein